MSPRRFHSSSENRGWPSRDKLRLVLEPLEARRLLAGIHVSVFLDQNGSRAYEPASDQMAVDRLVFVDLNLNGQFDAHEPSAATDRSGHALFEDLGAGDYSIGLLTNPDTQPQVFPSRVDGRTIELSSTGGIGLLVDADLASAWSVSAGGDLLRIVGREPVSESLGFGGALVTSSSVSDVQDLVIVETDTGVQHAALFDLETGAMESLAIDGLDSSEQFVQLARVGDATVALIAGADGSSSLAPLSIRSGQMISSRTLHVGERAATSAIAIAGSANSANLLVTQSMSSATSQLALLDPQADFSVVASMRIDGAAESVHQSLDGRFGFVAISGGGLQVAAVGPSALTLAAVLSEAHAPVSAGSLDGRIVTGSAVNENEVIVWNTSDWLPSGRVKLPAEYRVAGRSQLATDRRGDSVLVLTDRGARRIDLSRAANPRVQLDADDEQVETTIGVRVLRTNEAPNVGANPTRLVKEDVTDAFNVRGLAEVSDPEGDTLWFALAKPARHGTVSLESDGSLTYVPKPNFNGQDSAVIRVHDGQSSTDLVVRFQVEAVNDPPVAISVEVPVVSEATAIGAQLGFVSIVDVDADAEYRITSSDPRFTVERGRLYFVGGELDYESEPTIEIRLLATDVSNASIFIATSATIEVGDENDRPTAIRLSSWSIPENIEGAIVGEVIVEDQDADDYSFSVSDARFTIQDGRLRLADGVSLDHEQTSQVTLTIQATDRTAAGHQLSETVTLAVVNSNEAPVRIELEESDVESNIPGAWVGIVRVVDPDGDLYAFTVSDDRFEVVGTMLTLKYDQVVDQRTEPSIPLQIVARAGNGDQVTGQFNITVNPRRSPYQNPEDPNDVNGDGVVSPLDVLILINYLNREGGYSLPTPDDFGDGGGEGNRNFFDVNGDGVFSPADVLRIINFLNASNRQSGLTGEGESPSPLSDALVYGPQLSAENRSARPLSYEPLTPVPDISYADTEEFRKREASKIDSELESLLDQLSCARHS